MLPKRTRSALFAILGFVTFGALPATASAASKRPKGSKQRSVVDGDPALSDAAMATAHEEWTTYGPNGSYSQRSRPTATVQTSPTDASANRDPERSPETSAPAPVTVQVDESTPAGVSAAALLPRSETEPETESEWSGDPSHAAVDGGAAPEFKHKGFVAEVQGGAMGCTGSICAGSNGHNASAGARFDAFVGGNIAGLFELGVSGGYGTMTPKVSAGTNALALYGLELPDIPPELLNGFDLNTLNIDSARLDDLRVGPALRVHFVRKGRMQAYVGSGFGYHRFRGRYGTPSGDASLSFHGIDIPVEAGLGVYLSKRLSVGVRFDYIWTHYAAVSVKHPQANMVAPLGYLDQQLEARNQSLMGNLPQFWTTSLGLRLTL